jgi:hypothetical protein
VRQPRGSDAVVRARGASSRQHHVIAARRAPVFEAQFPSHPLSHNVYLLRTTQNPREHSLAGTKPADASTILRANQGRQDSLDLTSDSDPKLDTLVALGPWSAMAGAGGAPPLALR